ncbi:RNA-directed DNA polymerase, eukaryota, Reverse transcriptase zinc-binding domain protein [Artemisia annua]|uniref:RNA-directed DNA polymerase, eukaryota, Reverse transcriptase zinc-binding domain protein n=1 Tax=Artemisia annua TaxID=35608 RepID=A0A2U1LZ03_ARTAN|nr:RNA-directed DNA polymerase, eukaryota, Reverse transcriptase zinc-binding domain protein [Artemisia annua]
MEDDVRTKKSNKKSKNDARVSIKLSSEVAKSSHKIKKGTQKNIRSSSSVKSNNSVRSLDDMDEESEGMVEMKDSEEGIDNVEGIDEGLFAKKPKVSDVVDGEELHEGVKEQNMESVMFPEVEVSNFVNCSVSSVNNNNDSMINKSYVVPPDIHVPVHENPVLNPNQNKKVQPNNDEGNGNINGSGSGLVGNLNGSSEVNNGVQGVKSSEYVVGESSKSRDVEMQDTSSFKRTISFSNAVKGPYGSVNNRLRFIPVSVNDEVEVCYRGLGKSMHLKVDYAWKPPICSHCKVFGHNFKDCKNREMTVEEKLETMNAKIQSEIGTKQDGKSNDGWKTMQGKRVNKAGNKNQNMQQDNVPNRNGWNYARGGTSSRGGRGSGYVRGGYNGTRAYNDNRNATTNNKMNENVSSNVEAANVSKTNEKVNAMENKNGKTLPKENLKTNNSFGALVNDNDEDVINDWQNLKTKIDVACDLGLDIPEEERKKWTRELQEYYVTKRKDLEKSKRRSQLLDRIKSLEKEIGSSNRGIDAVVNKKTETLVTKEMENTGASRSQAYNSHSHLFFACPFSKRLWERLKVLAKLQDLSNTWGENVLGIVNKPAKNSIWSVIQRLLLGAVVYFIWQESNMRLFGNGGRSIEFLFVKIVETMRF